MRLALFFLTAALGAGQTCRSTQVSVSSHCCDGAMGSLHAQVFIRNSSREACLLEGTPKVEVLDESGHPLPLAVSANENLDQFGSGSTRLVLRPGGTAAITVVTEGPLYEESRCGKRLIIQISGRNIELNMPACGAPQQPVRVFVSGFRPATHAVPRRGWGQRLAR